MDRHFSCLILKALITIAADMFFFLFLEKIMLDISCESSLEKKIEKN